MTATGSAAGVVPSGVDPRIGTVLAERYKVIERWSQGGMGTVYRGQHVELEREVAIKFLHEWAASEPAFVQRFEREAKAMARLQHPGCAQILDSGVAGGAPFVVMEFVTGESLLALIDRGAMPPARAIEIARQVLAALDKDLIEANGGIVLSGVSKKIDFLLAGEEAGSKLQKATELGVAILDWDGFQQMLKGAPQTT